MKNYFNYLTTFKQRKTTSSTFHADKIFCISMQRTGTTSVGAFFRHFGYSVAGWQESKDTQWVSNWYDGNFEAIFNSKLFKNTQVFEDEPFWHPEFYKVLYHRFPNAKFILFTRDSDDWFRSMLHHSKGNIWDDFKLHCKLYHREADYYQKTDTGQETFWGHDQYYKDYYETRNREVIEFFQEKNSKRLIICDLNDADNWHKVGAFFDIDVPNDFAVHENQSSPKKKAFVADVVRERTLGKNDE